MAKHVNPYKFRKQLYVKERFLEAIWSKVDKLISKISPVAPIKVAPPGDTDLGSYSRSTQYSCHRQKLM